MNNTNFTKLNFDVSQFESLNERERRYNSYHMKKEESNVGQIHFTKKILYSLPILWLSGILTGMAIMIMTSR